MKKIYLLCLAFISATSFAQTLVQGDLPFAGLVWTSGVDTNYTDPVPPGGAAQNWDFSTLQNDYVDTSGFEDTAGTPYASTFPSANLAARKTNTNDWTYFTSASTGFYVNGFVTGTSIFVISPKQMYVPVPFSYGDMHTDISRVVVDTSYLTYAAQVMLNFHATFQADGYGSLTTPTATYPSTLRVKEIMLETDSLMVDFLGTGNYTLLGTQQSQITYYRWFQHGGTANYILGVDADSLGTLATRSDYVLQWAVLGTNEIPVSNELFVFPNPASKKLTLSNKQNGITRIDIYNLLGEKVVSFQPGITPGIFKDQNAAMQVDVSTWTPGIYFYQAQAGEKVFSGKFSVIH